MKLNLQKTTAAVLAVLLSAGVFAANNANAFEYGYKNHKYGKKWGKPASEAEGERVMKNAAYRSGVYYTNVNRIPARVDRNGVKTVQVNDARTRQNLGRYAFNTIKSGGSEVYYGEWVGKEYAKGTNRGVYYSGNKRATSMPVSGVANYAVKGINNYTGNNPLVGTLRADFGQKVLAGSMRNNAMQMDIHSRIKPSSASFEGYARANGHYGKTEGHFFGHNASALAGVAKFKTDRNLDTAYGGVKR